jgi:tRNA (guanine26-N2/guanine27-N2)-dimethyltransferase
MELFTEGAIKFFAENKQTRDSDVFFNPARKFDRDLNILFVDSLQQKNLNGIDLFGGSGVRSLRLAAETTKFSSFVINDIKTSKIIKKNVSLNKKKLKAKITVSSMNALDIYNSKEGYDYVDIDPFGSPIKYLVQAIPKVKYGGVLAITATDSAALYGKAKKACALKYGSNSFKTSYFHEVGLRILIKRTEEVANLHERSIEPLFFDVRNHYLRVYFRVKKASIKRKLGYIYQCLKCPNRTLDQETSCANCGSKTIQIGPLWLERLFDREAVSKMLEIAESKEVQKYLSLLSQEEDIISYYTTDEISSYLKTKERKISLVGSRTVLDDKGFRSSLSFQELMKNFKSS